MKTKQIRGQVKSIALTDMDLDTKGEDIDFRGYASKPTKDRYDEIVDVDAFRGSLKLFKTNPVMLYMHNAREPIGQFTRLELREDGLFVHGKIDSGYEIAERARLQVKQRSLRALSIGFIPLDGELDEKSGLYHIKKLELLEISLVSIPANQDALFTIDEDGKATDIELLETTELTDQRLLAMAKRRGLIVVPGVVTFTPEAKGTSPYAYDRQPENISKFYHHSVETLKADEKQCRCNLVALFDDDTLTEEEKRGVYTHLVRHLEDETEELVPDFEALAAMDRATRLSQFDVTEEDVTVAVQKNVVPAPPSETESDTTSGTVTTELDWMNFVTGVELAGRVGQAAYSNETLVEEVRQMSANQKRLERELADVQTCLKTMIDTQVDDICRELGIDRSKLSAAA